jgi:hypothetical protein
MERENNPKKEITLDDLARIMTESFKKSDRQTDKKIEDLALMAAKGFNEVNEKMDKGFKKVASDIKEIKEDTGNIRADLNKKVDKFTYNTLEYRFEKLEKKFV